MTTCLIPLLLAVTLAAAPVNAKGIYRQQSAETDPVA
jgi:hypothetical protein